jgi:hypothetical protein
MSSSQISKYGWDMKALAERLSECEAVTRLDSSEEKEAWTLAHAFLDLEESFRTYLEEQLPRLRQEILSPEDTYNLLLDIGEEFRHILYHLRDTRFYSYLGDDSPDTP